MTINQFTLLKLLINKCRKEEIKSLEAYLKSFYTAGGASKSKSIKLVLLILRKKELSEEDAIKVIYGDSNSTSIQAFTRLINRLKNKVFECLSLDVNIYRNNGFTVTQQYRMEIYKLLVYSEISRIRGSDFDTLNFYKRIILIGKRYELYSELSQVLFTYYSFLRFKSANKKLNHLFNDVIYYESCSKALFQAGELHNKLLLETQFKASGYGNIKHFEEAIEIIQEYYKKYKSASILHYLLVIKMELTHKKYDYATAEKLSYEQIELYKNHVAVKMPVRLGNAYLNLGNNQLFQFKFDDAIKSLGLAYDSFTFNGGNYNIVRETEAYVRFYSGELDIGEKLLRQILSLGKISNNIGQLSKRNYLLGCVLILKKRNKEAHLILQNCREIEKDKEGFNLGIRILSIINQLETQKLDIVDLNIESLRKHIERIINMKAVRKRDVVILKLLAKLSRQGFNFKQVWKKNQKYFDLLASNDPEYRWEMKSPEMIIFHRWFEAKAMGKEYDYVLRPPQETLTIAS
ncbi:MAG: hypothetical protein ABI772_08590 [Bacteroidota bacterium]